jgi:hypothetical protein
LKGQQNQLQQVAGEVRVKMEEGEGGDEAVEAAVWQGWQ